MDASTYANIDTDECVLVSRRLVKSSNNYRGSRAKCSPREYISWPALCFFVHPLATRPSDRAHSFEIFIPTNYFILPGSCRSFYQPLVKINRQIKFRASNTCKYVCNIRSLKRARLARMKIAKTSVTDCAMILVPAIHLRRVSISCERKTGKGEKTRSCNNYKTHSSDDDLLLNSSSLSIILIRRWVNTVSMDDLRPT